MSLHYVLFYASNRFFMRKKMLKIENSCIPEIQLSILILQPFHFFMKESVPSVPSCFKWIFFLLGLHLWSPPMCGHPPHGLWAMPHGPSTFPKAWVPTLHMLLVCYFTYTLSSYSLSMHKVSNGQCSYALL